MSDDRFVLPLDEFFASVARSIADAREKVLNEPWYGKPLSAPEHEKPGDKSHDPINSDSDLGGLRWKEAEPEPERQPDRPAPERGMDR